MRLSTASGHCTWVALRSLLLAGASTGLACRDFTEPDERARADPPDQLPAVVVTKAVYPQMDTYVRSDVANKNYGSNDSVRVQKVGSSGANRVLIAFGQSEIVDSLAGGSLVSATLEFTIKRIGNDWGASGRQVAAHRMTRAWTEGGATWNCANDTNVGNNVPNCSGNTWSMTSGTRPYVTTAVAQALIVNNQTGVVSLNVTSDVQAFLAGQATNHGWLIKLASETQTGTAVFWSRQATTKPRLVLSYNEAVSRPPLPDDITWPSGSLPVVTSTGNPNFQYYRTVYAVGFNASASGQTVVDFMNEYGATIIGGTAQQTEVPLYVIQVPDPGSSFAAVEALTGSMRQEAGVAAVVEMAFGETWRVEQRYPSDSGMAPTRASWFDAQNAAVRPSIAVRAPQAWGCETGMYGGTVTRVGVLDAFFDSVATDLVPSNAQVTWPADSAVVPPSYVDSARNHGTRVAGVLTAAGENGRGIAGMIWKTDLRLFAFGRGNTVTRSKLARFNKALKVASEQDVRILNVSGGLGDIQRPAVVDAYRRAVAAYLSSGTKRLLVLASGNEYATMSIAQLAASTDTSLSALHRAVAQLYADPAYKPKILFVTATDVLTGKRLAFANVWTDADMIAAPGTGVYSLNWTSSTSGPLSGTSVATPFVSGVAAQLWTMDPALTAAEVKQYILNGTRVMRINPETGDSAAPGDIDIPGIYQLDAYGSLSLMSRERQGTPICGFAVYAEPLQSNPRVVLERNGGNAQLIPITPGVPVPGWEERVALSVAQGGRLFAVNRINRNTGQGAVDEYALANGQWAIRRTITGRMPVRTYLEKDTVDSDAGAPVLSDTATASTWTLRGSRWGANGTAVHFLNTLQAPQEGFILWARFSPDGEYALVSAGIWSQSCNSGYGVYLVPLPSGTPQQLLPACSGSDTLSWYGADAMWDPTGTRFIVGEAWVDGGPDTVGIPTWSRYRPLKIVGTTAQADGSVQDIGYRLVSFYAAGAEGRWADPMGSFGWWMELGDDFCHVRTRATRGTFPVISERVTSYNGEWLAGCQVPMQMLRRTAQLPSPRLRTRNGQ